MNTKGQAIQKSVFSVLVLNKRLRLRGFLASLTLVWLAIGAYRYTSYYKDYLSSDAQLGLLYIAIAYSLAALFFYTLAPVKKVEGSKPLLTIIACRKIAAGIGSFVRTGPRDYTHPLSQSISREEKRALLFNLVKLFFIPLMLGFLIGNYSGFTNSLTSLRSSGQPLLGIDSFNNLLYPALFNLALLVDVVCFMFGYLFEASFLHNKLRSVEPTVLGWAVALVCYPPFNGLLGNYVPWYANDYALGSTSKVTFLLRLSSLAFMIIYASASVALGPKASNLTNRGIVGYGPYGIIRHPAYICKNIAWWITMLPVFSLTTVASMSVWSSVYFMRAITEERHLSADPDYVAYCKKVKYRFIPGII